MDILVLDAPMKFIHGKMVEQGAKEWSRYLLGQFNPIGRGTLYSECYDKENGLKVYLYSATITLECVGESKGYLKVIKAEETDVIKYHKVIEEGKLIEEKITFVPIYKFQYINTKEHNDVEKFMKVEENKRALDAYMKGWKQVLEENEASDVINGGVYTDATMPKVTDATEKFATPGVEHAIKSLYIGQTANKRMKDFLPELENLEKPVIKDLNIEKFTLQYDMLSDQQRAALEQALSIEDLYMIGLDNQGVTPTDSKVSIGEMTGTALIREMAQQVTLQNKRVMVVAPEQEKVEAILQALEEERSMEAVYLEKTNKAEAKKEADAKETESQLAPDQEEPMSPYCIAYKAQQLKNGVLHKLDAEASKHNRHKEELDHMKAECELYQVAEQTIKLSFDILELLKETKAEQTVLEEEAENLKQQKASHAEAIRAYEAIPSQQHEIYQGLKMQVAENDDLYDEMLWMKANERLVEYAQYKDLILKYSEQVGLFEEKVSTYKAQIAKRNEQEEAYKALEGKLLELRRQYLKTEALKQVDRSGHIQTDKEVKEEISNLEAQLRDLRTKNNLFEEGIISTRSLDELKVQVYKLKEEVDAYVEAHKEALSAIYEKEEVTKAEVIQVFVRMNRVENLFEENDEYESYLKGFEEYFKLEASHLQNEALLRLEDKNKANLEKNISKQVDLESLLSSKLNEAPFKAFLELIEEGKALAEQIVSQPLAPDSMEALENLEKGVQQREFKLHIYKEKVAFYEELAKLKEDWKKGLIEDHEAIESYLMNEVNVVGTTCSKLGENRDEMLVREPFEYVFVNEADQIPDLELLIPMIRGKKVVLIGNVNTNAACLFARLYENCPKDNKSLLVL